MTCIVQFKILLLLAFDFHFHLLTSAFGQNECHDPGIPINGQRFGEHFLLGSSVLFTCDEGFIKTHGSESITCVIQDGNVVWNAAVPRCEGRPYSHTGLEENEMSLD